MRVNVCSRGHEMKVRPHHSSYKVCRNGVRNGWTPAFAISIASGDYAVQGRSSNRDDGDHRVGRVAKMGGDRQSLLWRREILAGYLKILDRPSEMVEVCSSVAGDTEELRRAVQERSRFLRRPLTQFPPGRSGASPEPARQGPSGASRRRSVARVSRRTLAGP